MTESESRDGSRSYNGMFLHPNVLQLRLDTSDLIQRLSQYLSGEILIPEQDEKGKTKFITQQVGTKICNERGCQHLLNYVLSIVNPSVVQGNYELIQYSNHIDRIHSSLARQLLVNYHEWNMQYGDLEPTIDFIMNLVEPFLSRLIENKERESYAQSIKSTESSRVDSGGWSPLGGRK